MSIILEILHKDNNRSERKILTSMIQEEQDFDILYSFIRENDNPKGSYASWAFTSQSDQNKKIIKKYHEDLIIWLPQTQTNGILRSMLRSVAQYELPKTNESDWIDICFKYLIESEYEIAVKVHAMEILKKYCKRHPELSGELKSVIETGMENYSAALKARGRSVINFLNKM